MMFSIIYISNFVWLIYLYFTSGKVSINECSECHCALEKGSTVCKNCGNPKIMVGMKKKDLKRYEMNIKKIFILKGSLIFLYFIFLSRINYVDVVLETILLITLLKSGRYLSKKKVTRYFIILMLLRLLLSFVSTIVYIS